MKITFKISLTRDANPLIFLDGFRISKVGIRRIRIHEICIKLIIDKRAKKCDNC